MDDRADPRHNLRLTPELSVKLGHAAVDNGRSRNAEIIARLEKSFEPDPLAEIAGLMRSLASLEEADRAKAVDMLSDLAGVLSKSKRGKPQQ